MDLAADIIQRVAGRVGHFIFGQNRILYRLFQRRLGRHGIEQIVYRQHVVLRQAVPFHQLTEVAQCVRHRKQLRHGEHAALFRSLHDTPHILHRGKTGRTVFDQQRRHGVCLLQRRTHLVRRFPCGLPQQHAPCLRTDDAVGRAGAYLVEFQCF